MKIAYVTMAFPVPSETFASNDVRELAARGSTMTVHALRNATPNMAQLISQRGLESVRITTNTGLRTVARGLRVAMVHPAAAFGLLASIIGRCALRPTHLVKSLILAPRVLEVFGDLLRERPDVVHAFWSHYPSMVLLLVERYMPNTVTSMSFTAYDIVARYPLSGPVARRANVVRTLAKVTVGQVEERFGVPAAKLEVIHDGVDLDRIPPPQSRVARRLVTAGRLIEKKGMHHVLHAFAHIVRESPDATLRVLGDGPHLATLRALAADLGVAHAVTFAGHVPHPSVLLEMRQAHVFLFMSETASERLPNVVKEAMVCGCICVASSTDGIDELIDHGNTGFIVPQGDVDAAVRHIDDVFAGRVDTQAMADAAEAHVRHGFVLSASVERYLSLWADRLRAKHGP